MYWKSTLSATLLSTLAASAQLPNFNMPAMDAARATFHQTSDLDLDNGAGSLGITQFELRSALSRPITLANGWLVVPLAEYTLTHLDFSNRPAGFPMHDEDLHSLGLSAFAVSMSDSSPWIYGAWARAELASDFKSINGDDFTFDVAAGGGYRFNDHFILGVGAAVCNLNGNLTCYPGIGFDWIVNDDVRIGLYGPAFIASYTYSRDWSFSFRTKACGGIWNVSDNAAGSRSIDLTSYQLGVFADRRLTDKLWLSFGVGMVIANNIKYTTPHGDTLFERDADAGMSGQLGLRLKAW